MRVLDLFSGIGGFSLGLERAGMETVAFCEIEPFCQQVLRKHWPEVPIYDDVRSLDYDGSVDLICGGFPCQPFSVAGQQKGAEDDRHLWPAMFSLIQKYRPRWVIGENVAGFVNMALDDVLAQMEGEGYTCQAFIIPACALNAPHRRDRVWIIAHDDSRRFSRALPRAEKYDASIRDKALTSNSNNKRQQGCIRKAIQRFTVRAGKLEGGHPEWRNGWPISSSRVCGVVDGIPKRTHRLRALGNAVVPQIPQVIGEAIMAIEIGNE